MLLLALLAACSNDPADTDTDVGDTDPTSYPLDDVLTLFHVQTKGTHNSYHIAEEDPAEEFDYTHAPIDVQLEEQDVRHLEFDIERDGSGEYLVRHVYLIDDETQCATLTECVTIVKTWSDANPGHVPLVILLEIKQGYVPDEAESFLQGIEDVISGVWPRDRLIIPDDVQGTAASLADAVPDGWPTLGESRGKALFVLFDIRGDHRPVYTDGETTTAGRLLFPIGDGTLGSPILAMHWIDDPQADAAAISAAIEAGHLVRTRADAGNVEPFAGDTTRATAALATGAHLVSTDYPAPVDGVDYVFELPEGGGARCNPVTAPSECTTDAVEHPALLAP